MISVAGGKSNDFEIHLGESNHFEKLPKHFVPHNTDMLPTKTTRALTELGWGGDI